jgi:hypothetical protein
MEGGTMRPNDAKMQIWPLHATFQKKHPAGARVRAIRSPFAQDF